MMRLSILLLSTLALSCGSECSGPTKLPAFFKLEKDFPKNKKEIVLEAMKRWNQAIGKEVFRLVGYSQKEADVLDGENVIYWTKDVPPSAKAYTRWQRCLNGEVGACIQCDVKINSSVFGRGIFNPDGSISFTDYGEEQLETTLVHELGHCLNLSHSKDSRSVMYNPTSGEEVITDDNINRARISLGLEPPGGVAGDSN